MMNISVSSDISLFRSFGVNFGEKNLIVFWVLYWETFFKPSSIAFYLFFNSTYDLIKFLKWICLSLLVLFCLYFFQNKSFVGLIFYLYYHSKVLNPFWYYNRFILKNFWESCCLCFSKLHILLFLFCICFIKFHWKVILFSSKLFLINDGWCHEQNSISHEKI